MNYCQQDITAKTLSSSKEDFEHPPGEDVQLTSVSNSAHTASSNPNIRLSVWGEGRFSSKNYIHNKDKVECLCAFVSDNSICTNLSPRGSFVIYGKHTVGTVYQSVSDNKEKGVTYKKGLPSESHSCRNGFAALHSTAEERIKDKTPYEQQYGRASPEKEQCLLRAELHGSSVGEAGSPILCPPQLAYLNISCCKADVKLQWNLAHKFNSVAYVSSIGHHKSTTMKGADFRSPVQQQLQHPVCDSVYAYVSVSVCILMQGKRRFGHDFQLTETLLVLGEAVAGQKEKAHSPSIAEEITVNKHSVPFGVQIKVIPESKTDTTPLKFALLQGSKSEDAVSGSQELEGGGRAPALDWDRRSAQVTGDVRAQHKAAWHQASGFQKEQQESEGISRCFDDRNNNWTYISTRMLTDLDDYETNL
ncbi:hypothetical protein Anapl_08578 [Anas platyrhynchos]|uniref:Uncharacterized protein n=1 Tax=Anas platyrhynchos TaxID=8839 RepID=R0K8J9_ANAPL|nr:hypothetical protein Anapl_08578 [Anas platyrhynchos]